MDFPVFYGGETVGSVTLKREGLYAVLSTRCRRFAGGVQRLWGVRSLRVDALGVLAPEGGALCLRRRISAHALPEMPEHFLAGRAENGWLPWRGELAGEEIPSGWVREDQSAVAVPFAEDLPVVCFEHATELTPVTICGVLCLCLSI